MLVLQRRVGSIGSSFPFANGGVSAALADAKEKIAKGRNAGARWSTRGA